MKLRPILVFLLFGLFTLQFTMLSQDKEEEKEKFGWENKLVSNLGYSQSRFDNWKQGGENSWNWQFDALGNFVNNQPKISWENILKTSYGRSKLGDEESRKSADQIRLESALTFKMGIHLNPYVRVTGETQYTSGFRPEPRSLPRKAGVRLDDVPWVGCYQTPPFPKGELQTGFCQTSFNKTLTI